MSRATFQQWIEQFLAELSERRGRSPNTVDAYRTDLHQFLRLLPQAMGRLRLPAHWDEIEARHIWSYLEHLRRGGLSPASLNRKLATLRGFFDYLVSQGAMETDPTQSVRIPSPARETHSVLTVEEVHRLLAAPDRSSPIGVRDRAILETLYATGMRASELLALNVDDVDLEKRTVTCGKEVRRRRVPLSPAAVAALRAYLEQGRPALLREPCQKALFLNSRGQRMTRQGLWSRIRHHVQKAGIEKAVGPQTLRNSFAVHMLQAGVDLAVVQRRLGNSNTTSVPGYRNLEHLPDGFYMEVLTDRLVLDRGSAESSGRSRSRKSPPNVSESSDR